MRALARRLLVRIALGVFAVWAVFTVTFFLMHLTPGGPFAGIERLSEASRTNLEARFGLGDSLATQYSRLLRSYLSGDLGPSISFAPGRPVVEVLGRAAPTSLWLGGLGLLAALMLGGVGGLLAGRKRGGWLDRVLTLVSLLCISLSVMVLGGLLKRWALVEGTPLRLGLSEGWRGAVLPVACLGLAYGAIYFRLVRSSVISVMRGPRLTAVLARGVSLRRVTWCYLLPEAFIPLLAYLGPSVAAILTGSFVVETMFQIPGLAACFVQGALSRDYPLVCGSIVFYTALLVGLNLVFETLHLVLDPRLSAERQKSGEVPP